LRENREAGLGWEQVLPLLPGRSLKAIRDQYYKLKHDDIGSRANGRKRWSPEERQRAIDMILVDGLSIKAVSERLGRSKAAVQKFWQIYGLNFLPADMTQKHRGDGHWSPEQDQILIEQREKGVLYKDIALRIPGKSRTALYNRARRLNITRHKLSPVQTATIRNALQAVCNGTATFDEVASKFSSLGSRKLFSHVWRAMRLGLYKT
jgi:transposase-like protein